jgi:hypothetical protein
MNKKQLTRLIQTLVLSTAASINGNATDGEPEITENEARTLLAMRIRKASRQLVADAAGVDAEDMILVEPPVKVKKAAVVTDAS